MKINNYRVLSPIPYAAVLRNVGEIVPMSAERAEKYGAAVELANETSQSKESK